MYPNDMSFITTIMFAAIIGVTPAVIAYNKGRDFISWWMFGTLLFIIALPMALIAQPDINALKKRQLQQGNLQKCPYCAELIKEEAIICIHCGKELPLAVNHPLNLRQDLAILRSEAINGAEKIIEVNGKRISVTVPAGIKNGINLRLKGRGNTRFVKSESISGDLYLKVLIKNDEIESRNLQNSM